MAGTYAFDFFLSRRGAVASIANEVHRTLETAGYTVTSQDLDFETGDQFIERMHAASKISRNFIVLLNEDYDSQPYTMMEFGAFVPLCVNSGGERRTLIFRVDNCQPDGLMSGFVFQDLAGVDDPDQRRQRILDAAAGRTSPVPFRLVDRLADILVPPDRVADAWQQFVQPVGFVGRAREMAALNHFATDLDFERPFQWQVVYGSHATGKSRLAREWLLGLASKDEGWTVGFAPTQIGRLLGITSRRPLGPTAIVVDDARSYGEHLWQLIDAGPDWARADAPVRVLLLSHTDLDPPRHRQDWYQKLVKCRQSKPFDAMQIPANNAFLRRRRPTERVSIEGLLLQPLRDGDEQRALLAMSAERNGVTVDDNQLDVLLDEAEGSPAALLLAGRFGLGHRLLYDEYAESVAAQARQAFADPRDGPRLLATSVLVGPVSDSVAQRVAPTGRAAVLFTDPKARIEGGVPRFEPDLIGYHVLLSVLSSKYLTSNERDELLEALFTANPSRFIEQVTGAFEQVIDEAAYYAYLDGNDSLEARAAFTGDCLVAAIQRHVDEIEPARIDRLRKIRRSRILNILAADGLSDHVLTEVVASAGRYAAPNSFLIDVATAATELGITSETLPDWLTVLQDIDGPLPERLVGARTVLPIMTRDPRLAENGNAILADLEDRDPLRKLTAMFELLAWWRAMPKQLLELTPDAERLVDAFANALRDDKPAVNNLGAIGVYFCLRDRDRKYDSVRVGAYDLRDSDIDAIRWRLEVSLGRSTPGDIVCTLIKTLRLHYTYPGAFFDPAAWLRDQPFERAERVPAPEWVGSLLRRIASTAPVQNEASVSARVDAIFALAEINQYVPFIREDLRRALKARWMSSSSRRRIALGLAFDHESAAHDLLEEMVASGELNAAELRYLIAGCLAHGNHELVPRLANAMILGQTSFDVDELVTDSRAGRWASPSSVRLRRLLDDDEIGSKGHLIHKLKAKDSTGHWAYYFVLVEEEKEKSFMAALGGDGMIDLDDFGKVIASCYGETPNAATKRFLKERYNFDV